MLKFLKNLFKVPQPAGPPEKLRDFAVTDPVITKDGVKVAGDALEITFTGERSVALFTIEDPGVESCMLTYRARMKCDDLGGKGWLEMWVRMPGGGEFFSKGLNNPMTGTRDWSVYEVPFFLRAGQKPDLLRFNLYSATAGRISMKDIEIFKTPMA